MPAFKNVLRGRLLQRQLDVIALLRSGGGSLTDIATEMGVHVRTIRRDIAALEEAHYPVMVSRLDDGVPRYKFARGMPCPICSRNAITRITSGGR